MASPPVARRVAAAQPALPDELLEDIFLRLDAARDVASAAAACASFRRVVSGRRFLRRFLSLRPPPVLGFLELTRDGELHFHPAEPPHRSAPLARALAAAADFAFSFLPNPNSWRVHDARDGRVLLSRRIAVPNAFPDLVVCDPVHRRYVRIPRVPKHLSPVTPRFHRSPFLAPAGGEEGEEDPPLGVVWILQCGNEVTAFVFSSATGEWRRAAFHGWKGHLLFTSHRCAHGCFYWTSPSTGDLIMLELDIREVRFSVVHVPAVCRYPKTNIVELGEGRPGLLTARASWSGLELYRKMCRGNGVGAEEWQYDRTISLPEYHSLWIIGAAGGYILFGGISRYPFRSSTEEKNLFTLDLKTFLVERLGTVKFKYHSLYASYPPPLSLPSIWDVVLYLKILIRTSQVDRASSVGSTSSNGLPNTIVQTLADTGSDDMWLQF
ncbi:hypothetical protein ACP70R_033359 [Stipagrostis hirtigluma subsp. patula]